VRGQIFRTAYAAPARGVLGSSRSAALSRGGRQAGVVCSRPSRSRGPARCAPARLAWQAGLTPAAGVQTAECPDGTMATLATGHSNVIRCMPL